jgi:hypothetical protein
MIPVYTADSTLDAQLVQDLLSSAGITAHLLGRDVAAPEVPADGRIRVAVEDAEADLARTMLREWETSPSMDDESFDLVDSLPMPANR